MQNMLEIIKIKGYCHKQDLIIESAIEELKAR